MHANKVIQGLWVGQRLPTMQQISVASFLAHGHEFHLYAYSELDGVPAGTVMKDAEEIIPRSQVFRNSKQDTFAAFSDFFRYKLLLDKGGWWVDVDTVCLRPFDFTDDYVFSSEHSLCRDITNTGVIKAPQGSALLAYAWETCNQKDRTNLQWDEVGPDLFAAAVKRFSLTRYVRPALAFCPLAPHHWNACMQPQRKFNFGPETYAIHLWNEAWRRAECNVDAEYAPGSLYEQFKTKFLLKQPIDPRYNVFQVES